MILLLATAFGAGGVTWVEPPEVVAGEVHGRIQVQDAVDPARLRLFAGEEDLGATVRLVERSGTTTLLAIDASGSFRRHYAGALDLLPPLADRIGPDDEVGLVAFGRQTRAWSPTHDPAVLRKNLAEARAEQAVQKETRLAAAMLEGIDRVVEARPREEGGLRRLVVFTDAGEESGVFSPDEVVEAARSRRVRVDIVAFARSSDPTYAEDLDRLVRIARATGGDVLEIHDDRVAPDAFASLWAAPSGLFDLSADLCGEVTPEIVVRGPGLLASPAVRPAGSPIACTVATRRPAALSQPRRSGPEPDPSSTRQTVRPASRAAGLLCLLATFATFFLLLGVAFWFARRNAAADVPMAPPAPPSPPLPTNPPAPAPVVQPPPQEPENPAFSMKLPETHLVVESGDLPAGTRWRFSGRILRVGANPEDNDVVVDLPQVSGAHARFELYPSGTVFVEDCGSSNGTWLGAERLTPGERVEVPSDTVIALSSQLTLVLRSKTYGQGTP